MGIGQCWEFITLVHGQLQRHDFSYLDFFEKENDESGIDVFELFSAWQRAMFLVRAVPVIGSVLTVGENAKMTIDLLKDFRKVIAKWENEENIKEQTDNMIESIHEEPELLKYLTPEAKGRMLYDLLTVPTDWSERLDNLLEFDVNKRREEAALILIRNGVVSWMDWRETLERIGEIQNGEMAPRITPDAKPEEKAKRVRNNLDWLYKELLDDDEDWNALQAHLSQLPE